ncbi:11512_t:CDS:2 [Funneliformis geosporum]|nr:11512_t:CDS:2 [Funneliformis geosporum]
MAQKSRTVKKVYKQFLLPYKNQQPQSTTNGCKKRPQDKTNEIHISEPDEIPFSASRINSSVDNYNRQSQKSSNNDQCLLEGVKPGKNYRRCVWCIRTKWGSDSKDRKVGIQELCGDECLDFFMPDQTRSPNQVPNDINSIERNNVAMCELPSLLELVDATKNKLIDLENKEYFNDEYGITDINPLLEDNYRMSVLFLDSRGILFEWCEFTRNMYILGINEMEGFANIFYHPEKRCIIIKDTGEVISDLELERQAEESAKAVLANLAKA